MPVKPTDCATCLLWGIAQWGLALTGLVTLALLRGRRRQSRLPGRVTLFALMACLMIAMTVPRSQGLWERLPFLGILQFPWRLLGPTAACLAIVGSANGLWLERLGARLRTGAIALLVTLPIVASMPLLYMPQGWRTLKELDASLAAWHAETDPWKLSTTASGEFLPRDVHVFPGATRSLLADYADGYPVDKLNYAGLPAGSTARLVHNSPQALEWQIDAGSAFIAEVFNFHWEGWRAEVDGREVDIRPSQPHGLITFPLSAGNHRVRVFLGSTPARDLANGISMFRYCWLAAAPSRCVAGQPLFPPGSGGGRPERLSEYWPVARSRCWLSCSSSAREAPGSIRRRARPCRRRCSAGSRWTNAFSCSAMI